MTAGIKQALVELEEDKVLDLVRQALASGTPEQEILRVCQQGMVEIGELFETQDYFVSDLIISGEIFRQISILLEPGLKSADLVSAGSVVIGTVADDIHEIGKNIVITMLKSANFQVTDLGCNVAPEAFVRALQDTGAGVLGLSGLLTLAFDSMHETVLAVREAGLDDSVKVMIGGGPVDENIRHLVGADAWGADAQQAVRLARQWTEQSDE